LSKQGKIKWLGEDKPLSLVVDYSRDLREVRRDRETRNMRTMRTARSVWAVNSKDNKKDRGREEDVVHEMTTFILKIDNDWPEIGHALRETDSS